MAVVMIELNLKHGVGASGESWESWVGSCGQYLRIPSVSSSSYPWLARMHGIDFLRSMRVS